MNILENFERWLKSHGYSDKTPSGLPSTVQDYVGRVRRIADDEGLSIDDLAKKIDDVLPDYLPGGYKEMEGKKSHSAVANALKQFKEFVDDQK